MAEEKQTRPRLPDVGDEHDDVTHWIGKMDKKHGTEQNSSKPTQADRRNKETD